MVDIHPSSWVFLTAESLKVVAHCGRDADFKVIFTFLEVICDVLDSTTKILDASGLSVNEHLRNTFHEA